MAKKSRGPNLTDASAALSWARRHALNAFRLLGQSSHLSKAGLLRRAKKRVKQYVDFYRFTARVGHVRLWRAVRLESIGDLNTERIGQYWSFRPNGARQYHLCVGRRTEFGRVYILTAVARQEDIDWGHGFVSYMIYGAKESEVALLPDSGVLVTHVDSEPIDPFKASTGPDLLGCYHYAY
jgi:hypothetical protein